MKDKLENFNLCWKWLFLSPVVFHPLMGKYLRGGLTLLFFHYTKMSVFLYDRYP